MYSFNTGAESNHNKIDITSINNNILENMKPIYSTNTELNC